MTALAPLPRHLFMQAAWLALAPLAPHLESLTYPFTVADLSAAEASATMKNKRKSSTDHQ